MVVVTGMFPTVGVQGDFFEGLASPCSFDMHRMEKVHVTGGGKQGSLLSVPLALDDVALQEGKTPGSCVSLLRRPSTMTFCDSHCVTESVAGARRSSKSGGREKCQGCKNLNNQYYNCENSSDILDS